MGEKAQEKRVRKRERREGWRESTRVEERERKRRRGRPKLLQPAVVAAFFLRASTGPAVASEAEEQCGELNDSVRYTHTHSPTNTQAHTQSHTHTQISS